MTVKELLKSMAHNPGLIFTIYDDSEEVITFCAAGYEAISDTIGDRDVDKVTIAEDNGHIKLYLKALPTNDEPEEPEPEPTPDDNENGGE